MIDTLKLSKGLAKAGFSTEQAEQVAEALNEAQTDYVTKKDLQIALSQLEAKLVMLIDSAKHQTIYWIVGTVVVGQILSHVWK